MKKRTIVGSIALVAIVYAVGQMLGWPRTWSWHQKLTLEVQTPDGIKTASSVFGYQMVYTNGNWVPVEARGASHEIRGEAVVLEVAPGRYLFVLIRDMPNPFKVFLPGAAPVEAASRLKNIRETRELTPDQYPWIMTFENINDPKSVERVEPGQFAQYFGSGYALRSMTLAITDEPVTKGRVNALLPWLNDYDDKQLDGSKYETISAVNRFANSLNNGNFGTLRE